MYYIYYIYINIYIYIYKLPFFLLFDKSCKNIPKYPLF